jgi:hypothetical protein
MIGFWVHEPILLHALSEDFNNMASQSKQDLFFQTMAHLYFRLWFENPTPNVKMHLWMLGVLPFILTHFQLTMKKHLSQAMPSHQSWLTTPCFTQPWLQAQGWCYDNIPHLKWGQCPNWHYKIMFEALMFKLSLQFYFSLDFTFPFVLVTMSR